MISLKQSTKQLLKIASGSLFGRLGSDCLTFIIGLRVLQLTNSTLLFGFSQMIGPVISLLFLPVAGSIVDAVNKRWLLLLSQSASILALFFYFLSFSSVGFTLWVPTFLLLTILKCSEQLSHLGLTASIHSLVERSYIQRFKSIQQMIRAITLLSVPVLSVWLVNHFSLLFLIGLEIIFEGISVFIYSRIEFDVCEEEEPKRQETQSFLILFKEGISYVMYQPKLIFTVLFSVLLNFLFGAINIGLPHLQINYLSLPDAYFGLTETIFAVGLLLSSLILSVKVIRFPLRNAALCIFLIGMCFLCFGAGLPLLNSLWGYVVFISFFNFMVACLISWVNIPCSSWIIDQVPSHLHGRVFHLLNTGNEMLVPLGMFVFSILFDSFSPYLLFGMTGFMLMVAISLYPVLMKINLKEHSLEFYENKR